MVWILAIVAAAAVIAIALVAVGGAVGDLEQQDAPAVLLLEEAVAWIAERLPEETAGRLSYDDVTDLLEWHLAWFDSVGLSSEHGETLATPETMPPRPGPPRASDEADDAADDAADIGAESTDEALDYVVARALAADPDFVPVDAVVVIDLQHRYLVEIGAVEPRPTLDDPDAGS